MNRLQKWLVAVAVAFVAAAAPAQPRAFFKDGNALLAGLQANPTTLQNAYATGYVVASAEALNEERALSMKVCFSTPKNATQRQLIDIVKQFLEQNPAVRDLPAPWLVASALQRPFPCDAQAPK